MAASLAPQCTPLKQQYDQCFNRWYADKFLKGLATSEPAQDGSDRTECDELFKQYRACVWNAIEGRNLSQLITDARKDTADAFKADRPGAAPGPGQQKPAPAAPAAKPGPAPPSSSSSTSSSDSWHDRHSPAFSSSGGASSAPSSKAGGQDCEGDSCGYVPRSKR